MMEAKNKVTLIKVGGKVVENEETLDHLLTSFSQITGYKALIHGGGRLATQIAEKLGVETQMIDGRRITSDEMLDVVTMVYGGLVNKKIVAALQAKKVNALGLTGADLNCILSAKRPVKEIDYGWAADVKKVEGEMLSDLIRKGIVPVMAPLTHDGNGHMLNTNADTIAGELAKALAPHFEVTLVYCFEMEGVLRSVEDSSSVIDRLDYASFQAYVKEGIIEGGMIPKLDNAFEAVDSGVREVIITKSTLINDLTKGTHILA